MAGIQGKRRAVHEEQKEERRQAIVEMAWRMFQGTRYEALTVAGVAEELGLAKGTMYLYFKTKEALFLAVLEQCLREWFAEVDTDLQALIDASTPTIPQVTRVLCQALEARPGLTRLLAILHTLLENNIALDTAMQFKRLLLEHFTRTGALLERCLPFLQTGEGARLLLRCHALVIGLWHLADPSPLVRQVLQQPEFSLFEVQFAPEFSATLQALLYGLQESAAKGKAE